MATHRRDPAGRPRDPLRPRRAIHLLGLQPQRPRRRPRPVDGSRRQRRTTMRWSSRSGARMQVELLNRKRMEDPDRARHRDPRLHRALPQHPTPPLSARHAHPNRIRGPLLPHPQRRLTPEPRLQKIRGRSRCPPKRGNSTVSGDLHVSTDEGQLMARVRSGLTRRSGCRRCAGDPGIQARVFATRAPPPRVGRTDYWSPRIHDSQTGVGVSLYFLSLGGVSAMRSSKSRAVFVFCCAVACAAAASAAAAGNAHVTRPGQANNAPSAASTVSSQCTRDHQCGSTLAARKRDTAPTIATRRPRRSRLRVPRACVIISVRTLAARKRDTAPTIATPRPRRNRLPRRRLHKRHW